MHVLPVPLFNYQNMFEHDLLIEVFTKEVCELFTGIHTIKNISVILILQNIFHEKKSCRLTLGCCFVEGIKKIILCFITSNMTN